MKIKSVSGITCFVKDLARTARFYETLGFEVKKKDANHVAVYSNWFWIDFLTAAKEARPEYKKEAALSGKGGGLYIYLSVDDIDGFHKALLSKGIKPDGEPRDASGNREFVLRDPDGYKLVIFRRK